MLEDAWTGGKALGSQLLDAYANGKWGGAGWGVPARVTIMTCLPVSRECFFSDDWESLLALARMPTSCGMTRWTGASRSSKFLRITRSAFPSWRRFGRRWSLRGIGNLRRGRLRCDRGMKLLFCHRWVAG